MSNGNIDYCLEHFRARYQNKMWYQYTEFEMETWLTYEESGQLTLIHHTCDKCITEKKGESQNGIS